MVSKLHYILTVVLLSISCTTADPFISTYILEDQWLLEEVVAPSYPFPEDLEQNPISIAFPKTEEYQLFLKIQNCSGTYVAKQNGDLEFKRSTCSISCCDSEWDHYFITLLKKISSFETNNNESLKLIINEDNYILFTHQNRTISQ